MSSFTSSIMTCMHGWNRILGSSELIWKVNSHFGSFKLKELTKIGFLSKQPWNRDLKVPTGSYDYFGLGRMFMLSIGSPGSISALIMEWLVF